MTRLVLILCSSLLLSQTLSAAERPNIILMMADDLGYGDTGFTGHKIIRTPHLDQMARDGAVLTHFHAGGPVCSPTRGTFVTGRHNFRYGIFGANVGHLPKQEITLAEIAKEKGYTTGHFGKWHLGTLDPERSSKGAARKPRENYSPAAWHGYDQSFVVESSIATWTDPEAKQKKRKNPKKDQESGGNPFYQNGKALDGNDPSLKGGAGKVVMDRALPFIAAAAERKQPFLAVIWFNAPHAPVVASPSLHQSYTDQGVADGPAHYYGCITEMDQQIGRLRSELKRLGVAENTLIKFTSDNGPEGKQSSAEVDGLSGSKARYAGVTAGLRGRKRSLYEGGVRVPTLAVWPGRITAGSVLAAPSSTLDYLPTIAELLGYTMPDKRPIDGVSLLPLFSPSPVQFSRSQPIPFLHRGTATLIDGDFKLVVRALGASGRDELFHLGQDRTESSNVIEDHPERALKMREHLLRFIDSAKHSHAGADYRDPTFKPVDPWPEL